MNRSIVLAALFLFFLSGHVAAADKAVNTPLDAYVAKPDESYKWIERRTGKLNDTQYAELILTSQTWRDIVWKHQLFIIKPTTVDPKTKHALLYIAGGSWKDELERPDEEERLPREADMFAALAAELKTPVAVLLQVPHQPVFDGKYEDEIIAYTFEQYLKSGDDEWPLLLPMVKSAVRGMDTVQEYAKQQWSLDVQTFTVSGASKRGWTTWLTGAVDRRAIAIAPMVIDMLNMGPQMKHQLASWGAFSEQINDYTERGLIEPLQTEIGKKLTNIVDPYSYRDRIRQPKLIILGTNDDYWPLDALNLYWDDLLGEKHILYVPNNGHGIKDYGRVIGSVNALHQQAFNGQTMPKLTWQFKNSDEKLALRISSDMPPSRVRIWRAQSDKRDFRKANWTSVSARADGDEFVYAAAVPKTGYEAMFGEAVYEGNGLPFFLSTNVRIIGGATGDASQSE